MAGRARQRRFHGEEICVGTNLIHDFTAVTFSVKLAFFCENAHFRVAMIFHEICDFS